MLLKKQMFFGVIPPAGITLILRKEDNDVCIAFVIAEINLLLGVTFVIAKKPQSVIARCIAFVRAFIHYKVGIAFIAGDIDFDVRIAFVLAGKHFLSLHSEGGEKKANRTDQELFHRWRFYVKLY
jgi:hypothetical protein